MDEPKNKTKAPAGQGKRLTFELNGEIYGLDILSIREIIGVMDITPVPQSPPHVLGVVNLRGRIIPVVDLRQRLGMSRCEIGARTCIIVVSLEDGNFVGAVVDAVAEVVQIPAEEIEPPPSITSSGEHEVVGVAKARGRVILLLDAGRTFGEIAKFAPA